MESLFMAQIQLFAGNFAPRNWAFCDGQLLAIASNTALFSILGTTYGGDGRTTFGLPDLRGRAAMHAGNGPGLGTVRLGEKSGVETNTLNTNNLPSHTHTAQVTGTVTLGVNSGAGDTASPAGNVPAEASNDIYSGSSDGHAGALSASLTATLGNTGNNQAVNNIQPSLALNYIIALQGPYPSRS